MPAFTARDVPRHTWVAQTSPAPLPSWPPWQLAPLPNLPGHPQHAWTVLVTIANEVHIPISHSYLAKCQRTRRGGGPPSLKAPPCTQQQYRRANCLLTELLACQLTSSTSGQLPTEDFLTSPEEHCELQRSKEAGAQRSWCIILRSAINKRRERKPAQSNCFPLSFFSFNQYLFLKAREFYRALVK